MTTQHVRPDTLHEGDTYYYIEQSINGGEPQTSIVTLLAYDTCPALVIVASQDGRKWRCPQERLYGMDS